MCENGGTGVLCEHYALIKSIHKAATPQNGVNSYDMKCNYRVLFGPLNTVQRAEYIHDEFHWLRPPPPPSLPLPVTVL